MPRPERFQTNLFLLGALLQTSQPGVRGCYETGFHHARKASELLHPLPRSDTLMCGVCAFRGVVFGGSPLENRGV